MKIDCRNIKVTFSDVWCVWHSAILLRWPRHHWCFPPGRVLQAEKGVVFCQVALLCMKQLMKVKFNRHVQNKMALRSLPKVQIGSGILKMLAIKCNGHIVVVHFVCTRNHTVESPEVHLVCWCHQWSCFVVVHQVTQSSMWIRSLLVGALRRSCYCGTVDILAEWDWQSSCTRCFEKRIWRYRYFIQNPLSVISL